VEENCSEFLKPVEGNWKLHTDVDSSWLNCARQLLSQFPLMGRCHTIFWPV